MQREPEIWTDFALGWGDQQRTDSGTAYARAPTFGVYHHLRAVHPDILTWSPDLRHLFSLAWAPLAATTKEKTSTRTLSRTSGIILRDIAHEQHGICVQDSDAGAHHIPERRFSGQHDHGVGVCWKEVSRVIVVGGECGPRRRSPILRASSVAGPHLSNL